MGAGWMRKAEKVGGRKVGSTWGGARRAGVHSRHVIGTQKVLGDSVRHVRVAIYNYGTIPRGRSTRWLVARCTPQLGDRSAARWLSSRVDYHGAWITGAGLLGNSVLNNAPP